MAERTKRFKLYLKQRGIDENNVMSCLAGVQELRDVVAWADRQPEYTHDNCTPNMIIDRYREENE